MIPQVSLIECIPNIAQPTSIVLIPVPDAIIGPIVDPQGESFFTMIYWIGTSAFLAKTLKSEVETKSEAYLWL